MDAVSDTGQKDQTIEAIATGEIDVPHHLRVLFVCGPNPFLPAIKYRIDVKNSVLLWLQQRHCFFEGWQAPVVVSCETVFVQISTALLLTLQTLNFFVIPAEKLNA
jgi:hypothetical protein